MERGVFKRMRHLCNLCIRFDFNFVTSLPIAATDGLHRIKEVLKKEWCACQGLKAVNVRLSRGNQWEAVICNSAVQQRRRVSPKTTITFFVRPVLAPN